MPHLVAFVASLEHATTRYRVAALSPHLEAHGWMSTIEPLPQGGFARRSAFRKAGAADAVLLQRKLLGAPELASLRRHARRLVYDFDDAIFQRDSFAPEGPRSSRRVARFRRVVRAAHVVLAGNGWLAERARAEGARDVRIQPTCVDTERYVPRASGPMDPSAPLLVWIGSASTLGYLEAHRAAFDAIGAAVPGARLRVIADGAPDLGRLRVEAVPWRQATEVVDLVAGDIGVSPLLDDDWCRGKCGLKVLQFFAAGVPVVASPVGLHRELVEPGVSGLLATTPDEWVDAIRRLAGDPALATACRARGREIVRERHDVSVGAAGLLDALGTVLDRG